MLYHMITNRKLNWRPDRPDHRDFLYCVQHPETKALLSLPSLVDLRPGCSPVVDQGEVGSCTGNAIAGAIEYLEVMELKQKLAGAQAPQVFTPGAFDPISRLFIYYNERLDEGMVGQDSGAVIRDGINAIRYYGVCREKVWPYDTTQVFSKPSEPAYREAATHKAIYHYRLNSQDFRRCLYHQYPFVFGITVFDSFLGDFTARTGRVSMPHVSESIQGGHAMLCVGYNDVEKVFIVKNSWGTGWGDSGYCYIPYNYLMNPGLAADFWTIRRTP